ncbi:MAG: hypothetical protein DRN81_03180 [Thermoproteota archaeon]|nr:MAG: hypothetical protein DRN81_03180 [Candidatus Korarchaeota archaeon]
MVDFRWLIGIITGLIAIGGATIKFFQLQTRQNMKIEQLKIDIDQNKSDLQKALDEVRRKQSVATTNQIKTEKDLVAINGKLDHILLAIEDLKNGK